MDLAIWFALAIFLSVTSYWSLYSYYNSPYNKTKINFSSKNMLFSTKNDQKRQSLNHIFPLLQQISRRKQSRVKIFAIFGPFYSKISEYDFLRHFLGILMTVLVTFLIIYWSILTHLGHHFLRISAVHEDFEGLKASNKHTLATWKRVWWSRLQKLASYAPM